MIISSAKLQIRIGRMQAARGLYVARYNFAEFRIFCISVRTFWPKLQISTRRIEGRRRWHAGISRSRNFYTPRQTFLTKVAITVISFLAKVTRTSIEMKFSKIVSSSQLRQARLFRETIIFPVVGSSSSRYPRTEIERNKGRAKQSNGKSKFSIDVNRSPSNSLDRA